jgi:hypothetical protein
VNNIVNTSQKSLLLVKLVTIAGCVRVRLLLHVYGIHRNKVIEVVGLPSPSSSSEEDNWLQQEFLEVLRIPRGLEQDFMSFEEKPS